MVGFKVLTKQGLRGPFRKSSILKAITSAVIPLQARLLDLETGRYVSAAELVGEQPDAAAAAAPEIAPDAAKARADAADLDRIEDYVMADPDELTLTDDIE